jgi:hypothetical protein
MPTQVGIHDYGMARKKGVDGEPSPPRHGEPSPAMTGRAWSVPRLMQLLLAVAYSAAARFLAGAAYRPAERSPTSRTSMPMT